MYEKLSLGVLPNLIKPGSKILAAVSGGPDSIAMIHILSRYAFENKDDNISLVVTHVNHGVRRESEEEEELVKNLADVLGIPCIVHKFNAKKYAIEKGESFQLAAREWRYERWKEDMNNYGCNILATAHHLGDQAETVLYRLFRGSGTAGLAGIYPFKDGMIRPLLKVSKKEIIEYLNKEKLIYATDNSNFEPVYDRNKIRLELIPVLEQNYNIRVQEALGRTADLLREDEDYIGIQVQKKWEDYCLENTATQVILSYGAWDEHKALISRLLRKAASLISGDPRGIEYKYIEQIIQKGMKIGWKQDLPGLKVEAKENGFSFFREEFKSEKCEQKSFDFLEKELKFDSDKMISIAPFEIQVGIFNSCPEYNPEEKNCYLTVLNKKEISLQKYPLVCRGRRSGDRMYFSGVGRKLLKKIFQEHKIKQELRNKFPVIAVGSIVVWIPGICRSDSFIPSEDKGSEKVWLMLKYEK
ncbi:MAG: tRNA lysidine(34) synthetase TilS [Eubacteriales bacterium]